MQSLDIVKLIEKNSNTRLSKEYEHKLLNKINLTYKIIMDLERFPFMILISI